MTEFVNKQSATGDRSVAQGRSRRRIGAQLAVGLVAGSLVVGAAPQAGQAAPATVTAAAPAASAARQVQAAEAAALRVRTLEVAYSAAAKAKRKTVALTFDDGPSKYTPQVLDILKRNNVKATFCMLGNNVGPYQKTAKRIVREGHRLCNHSRNHPDFTDLSTSSARSQVVWTQKKIKSVTGRSPQVFRFPYGASNSRTRKVVRDQGLRILGWTVDTRDWSRPGTSVIVSRAVGNTRPGGVILMHDGGGNRSQTVAALDKTIKKLKAKGYTFVLA
ncbi:putative polysaccharide deacetylase [Actinoplanes missouriensis 431]|uniref:Putative polysaccharide deacetylase n=1 Tax=Actinoplanes missouriensis (strain ATCC 14538 / DSM 43046 / CBS 188.64 / JCM 3121 / NBRC 102363 / NCIMB 12654 / NRRL B-3342 / UNCC 431) TaxID=512565 RepID=I0H8F3_ACTM4|nr:polysaccharide deacetylase family protein [Actinoplanes missouriensis]BAL89290.1 putative polysaccharide deacetylase [Actinoplanes missouriensis 431]